MVAVLGLLRRWRSDSGAELVEFALVAPLLLLFVFGIFDVGLYLNRLAIVTSAAREAARIASLPDKTLADAEAVALDYLTRAGLPPGGTANVTPITMIDGSCGNEVFVRYPHYWLFVGIMSPRPQIEARSTMRLEEAAAPCP